MPKEPIDLVKVSPHDWMSEEQAVKEGFGLMAQRIPAIGREPFLTDIIGVIIFSIIFAAIAYLF